MPPFPHGTVQLLRNVFFPEPIHFEPIQVRVRSAAPVVDLDSIQEHLVFTVEVVVFHDFLESA